MASFRCPYCQKEFGPNPAVHCPHCAKTIIIPGRLRKTTLRDRKRMREKIAHNAEHQRREQFSADIRFGRSPMVLGIVIIALVVLGSLVVGRSNMTSISAKLPSREDVAARELGVLRIALERFRTNIGRYPTTDEGLKALVLDTGIPKWGKNYITIIKPDPWRTPYQYSLSTNDELNLRSAGPDRKPGTVDDIIPVYTAPEDAEATPIPEVAPESTDTDLSTDL